MNKQPVGPFLREGYQICTTAGVTPAGHLT